MEITLREARKLDTRIGNTIRSMSCSIETEVDLNVFESVDTVESRIEKAQAAFSEHLQTIVELERARSAIRRSIQISNETAGINEKIAGRHQVVRILEHYQQLSASLTNAETPSLDAIKAQIKSKRENNSSVGYSRHDGVGVSVVTSRDAENIETNINSMRLSIDKIETELSVLNLNTSITLDDETVETLVKNKIINSKA